MTLLLLIREEEVEPTPLVRPDPSEVGTEMLERLPTFLWPAPEIAHTLEVLGREIERIDDAVTTLTDNFFPHKSEEYLHWWERLLGLSVNPPDKTLEQRRTSVLAFLAAIKTGGTGLGWQEGLTRLIGSNWTYEEHDPADAGSPPPYSIRITLPYRQPIDAPTVAPTATVVPTASGPAAYYAYTAINEHGETPPSPVRTTTLGTTRTDLTLTAVSRATGYRIYRGTLPTTLRRIGETAALTFSDTNLALTSASPPTGNTTRSPQAYEAEVLARAITPAHLDLLIGYDEGFLVGISQVGEEFL